jgi:hypothetical protein
MPHRGFLYTDMLSIFASMNTIATEKYAGRLTW